MVIGIDLRALQTGHKYRGIGEVTKQVTNRVLQLAAKQSDAPSFIFYEYDDDDPKELLELPVGIKYEVVKLGKMPENDLAATTKEKFVRNYRRLFGSPVKESRRSDVYLQFDYAFGVPRNTHTVLMFHDLIPYVFWDKYFESAWVPFKNKAARTTLRTLLANYSYTRILRRSLRNARTIVAISENTKRDLMKYFKVRSHKIVVDYLGTSINPVKTNDVDKIKTMPTKPYLLFIGAGDSRRRVDDLVAAYNNLKAEGHDIQLVLVGENFKSPETIPNQAVRNEVLRSSYLNDILALGYIDDATKQKLYKEALAFVYPTKYEGFGLPILESMLMDCPIITYKNSSIPEVGGSQALYATDWADIKRIVKMLLDEKPAQRQSRIKKAKKYATKFTWDKTASRLYEIIMINMNK